MDRQIQLEDATDSTSGGSVLLEAGSLDQSSLSATLSTATKSHIFDESGNKIMIESDNEARILSEESGNEFYLVQDTAATDSDRPLEGDLVYHPVLKRMFEISFVDHDEPFHQLDNNPVYKLRCRQYEYSQEQIDTGITAIDEVEDDESLNALVYQFTLEQSSAVNEDISIQHSVGNFGLLLEETDGDNIIGENDSTSVGESIILENGSYLLNEDYIIGDFSSDKTAQNELFDSLDDDILDFSESNPFGDAGET